MAHERAKTAAGQDSLYGIFAGFPDVRHGVASVKAVGSKYRLQMALADVLTSLNRQRRPTKISVANHSELLDGEITFESGIAEDDCFVFFDDEERSRFIGHLEAQGPFRSLDFFVIVRYSVPAIEKQPWLDRYMVRTEFYDGAIDLIVVHTKGLQRIDTEGIIRLLVEELRKALAADVEIISLKAV